VLQHALSLSRERHGSDVDHPTTASILNSLGEICTAAGEPARAVEHLKEALAMLERCGRGRSPATAASLANLADALHHKGDDAGALEHAERALELFAATADGHGFDQYMAKARRLRDQLGPNPAAGPSS
jgi:tetratricopeptide (TPR) repeat protein